MPIYACDLDINSDGYVDLIILYAGEEELQMIKAMMPHEFNEALDSVRQEE